MAQDFLRLSPLHDRGIMSRGERYQKDFKVAIVGGGMCGLACAVGLLRAGVEVDVFEAAPKFEEIGAGVGLGPNAISALDGLGVLDAVLSRADQPKPAPRPFRFISGMDFHDLIYEYPVQPTDVGLGIHRAAFLEALVGLVDPKTTHFNKRCISVQTPTVGASYHTLSFADGTTHRADVVIGADGIKSSVRNSVVGDPNMKQVVFTNTVAYRGLVPVEALKLAGVQTDLAASTVCFVGRDKHIITFPIKNKTIINIVVFATDRTVPMGVVDLGPGEAWVTRLSEEQLYRDFDGWGGDVLAILRCLTEPSRWSIHAVYPPLQSYVKGKIALLGDAAHGMLPHLGAGAGQGFEDCLAICKLLGHPSTNSSNLEDALRVYDSIRCRRANMVLEASTRAGEIYESFGKDGYGAKEIQKDLTGLWDPVWYPNSESDIQAAVEEWGRAGAST